MEDLASIILVTLLGIALAGCSSGEKAQLVDKFSDDFKTFKKQALECEKVVFYTSLHNEDFIQRCYHKEFVSAYLNELEAIREEMSKVSLELIDELEAKRIAEGKPYVDNPINLSKEFPSYFAKRDAIIEEMQKYELSKDESLKHKNTCEKLDGLAEFIQNQVEYDIYKERFSEKGWYAKQDISKILKNPEDYETHLQNSRVFFNIMWCDSRVEGVFIGSQKYRELEKELIERRKNAEKLGNNAYHSK